jgi:hypothetical protein
MPQKAEHGFTIVINDAEFFLEGKIRAVQHMHKAARIRVTHPEYAFRQQIHEGQVLPRSTQFRPFDQGQQGDAVAAQLDLPGLAFHQKGRLLSGRGFIDADEFFDQVVHSAA